MAITSITISQENRTASIDLLSVHNPLVFLIDAAYTSSVPDVINVKIYDSTPTLLATFACIPYSDTTGVRTFAFIANDILKAYMGSIDDFAGTEKVLEYVDGITKEFTLEFYDPSTPTTKDDVDIVAMHASRQYGNTPYLESIYTNENEVYYAAVGMPVYCYFYNDSEANIITVGSGEFSNERLLDYDSVALLDFDESYLLSL